MKKNKFVQIMLGVSASAVLCSVAVNADSTVQGRKYGADHPFQLSDLPKGQLTTRLNTLAPKARENAKRWMNRIQFHDRDIPFMRTDENGGIYIADPVSPNAAISSASRLTTAAAVVPVGVDVFKLHSNPGAPNVVYLDFDGHVVSGTAWNTSTTPTYNAVPYDVDGIPSSFSDTERANIAEIWRRVAEDYAPFNIDVTTELPTSFGPKTGRVLITSNVDANGLAMPSKASGGVAYIDVWGYTDYPTMFSPAFAYHNQVGGPDNIAEVVSHELGHNLGLTHDGTSTTAYYMGHGSGFIKWAPIMGGGYSAQVSQWSMGEYADANQTQDDITLISNKLTKKADDHSDTRSNATPLVIDATGHIFSVTPMTSPLDRSKVNRGTIGTRTDIDVFNFSTGGGNIVLQTTPLRELTAERGGNLDISLSLYDSAGTLITTSNPADETDAGINTTVAAGTYYLAIDGVGSANYSDYGSLGQYFIEGVVPVAAADTTAPNPNPMTWSVAPEAKSRSSVHMTATTATDDTSSVQYYFACTSGGVACVDSGWVNSPDFTLNGLAANSSYSFTVKARDLTGNQTNPSALATVNTLANKAPVANADSAKVVNNTSVAVSVLANDSDPEADPIAVTAVTQGTNGSVTFTNTGLTYKPNSSFVGTDTFAYTISDSLGASATATVSVNVTAAPVMATNRLPVAVNDTVKVAVGQTVNIPVLSNDYDPDGSVLTLSSVKQGSRGDATIINNAISYKAGTRTGTDTLTYTITDGRGGKASAKVYISIVR